MDAFDLGVAGGMEKVAITGLGAGAATLGAIGGVNALGYHMGKKRGARDMAGGKDYKMGLGGAARGVLLPGGMGYEYGRLKGHKLPASHMGAVKEIQRLRREGKGE